MLTRPSHQPGLAVGMWRNGRPELRRFRGLARRDTRVPVTADTVFDIASVSKIFTGLGILMLIADGRLDRDTFLRDVLPPMRDAGGDVTVGHLLHHCSGLPDYMDLFERQGLGIGDRLGQKETLDLLAQQPPPSEPGLEYRYSNSGYVLLASIIEHLSGQSHAEFTKARIFDPLGMERTHLVDKMPARLTHLAQSYDESGDAIQPLWEMTGDGQIHSTLDDLAKWAVELTEGRVFPSLIPELLRRGQLRDGTFIDYGAGIAYERINGQAAIGHDGGWAGFRSSLLVMPSQRLAVIALANRCDIETGDMTRGLLTGRC